MNLDVEEIIERARNKYATAIVDKDVFTELKDLVVGQAIINAFDAYFAMNFPDFSLDSAKPEVLSFRYDSPLDGGQVVIGDIDTGSFEDEMVLYLTMNEAESWVGKNIDMIMSLVRKQDLEALVDQYQADSPGL